MISNSAEVSGIPLLDNIQEVSNPINVEDVRESQREDVKIVVKNKVYEFVVWKERNRMKAKYEGNFRMIIQKDSIDLIEELVYAPESIRFGCRDAKDNLLVHVLCWRGFVSYAKHFINKENSMICDSTGWSALHYACHSDNLKAVRFVFQNGDDRAAKIKDNYSNYAIDLTDNKQVRNFLTSSISGFQKRFRKRGIRH